MRPLGLQVENLTSFRGRQPRLDFTECELFAIAGPTGSGKSSLLDAMVFALYGNIPRVGKSCSEMISLGGDRLGVVFDFRLGAKAYRVTRTLRRGRSAEAQIEDISGPAARPIADGVRAVDAEVGRLLGLNFDAFVQCVILPQGEFARFLKSSPGDRRDILRKLLRLTIYERMRVKASQDADALKERIRTKREFCDQNLADATPAAIAALEQARAELCSRIEASADEILAQEQALVALRERNRLTRDLRAARAVFAGLEARKDEVEKGDAGVREAVRAAAVIPALDSSERARERSNRSRLEAEAAAGEFDKAAGAHADAEKALLEATTAANERPALEERLRVLTGAIALLKPLTAARKRVEEVSATLRRKDQEADGQRKALDGAQADVSRLAIEAERLNQEIDSIGYDGDRHRRLVALLPRSGAVTAERKALAKGEETLRAAEERHRRLVEEARQAADARSRAERALAGAEASRQAAEEALSQARRADMAAHLRSTLHEGSPCPVCDRPVSRLPTELASPALESLEAALVNTEERVAEAQAMADRARTAAVTAETRALEAEQATAQASAEESASRNRLAALVLELVSATKDDLDLSAAEPPEARLSAELQGLEAARQKHDGAAARRQKLADALATARTAATAAQQQVELLAASIRQDREALERASVDLRAMEKEMASCGTSDPEAEGKAVTARLRDLQAALEKARSTESTARERLAAARSNADQTHRKAEDDAAAATDAERAATEALQEGGFDGPARARAAFLSPEQMESLQADHRRYHEERHAFVVRIAELEKALGNDEVEDAAVEAFAQSLAALRDRHTADQKEQARLDQRIAELHTRADQASKMRSELAVLERQHALQDQLASDLGGPKFQEFLLRQILRELADGASTRLQRLTSRYGLALEDNEFVVVDHDSAGERRSANTLSGGETFLASLALALELSEQVRRAAGALDLDSLFIDEGFGTLDPETLDTVTTAIESLKVTGRMVGIITHIQELTARFPVQLHISKGAEGARVEVRHA